MLFQTHRRGKDSAAVYVTSQRERENPIPERDESPFGRVDQAFLDLSEQVRPAAPRLPASLLGEDHDTPMTPLAVRTRIVFREGKNKKEKPPPWIVDGDAVTDRVWWYIAARARAERGDWLTVAAGMAIIGMREMMPENIPPWVRPLIQSDMISRLVELMAGVPIDYAEPPPDTPEQGTTPEPATTPEQATTERAATPEQAVAEDQTDIRSEMFDITAPYMFVRIMDRINYAALRRARRSSAPRKEESEEEGNRHVEEVAARQHNSTPGRLHHGDPLIVLAGLVRDGQLNRLDGSLLAHAYVGGWSQLEAFTAVRVSLPGEVGDRTDEGLRGRLERAREHLRTIYADELADRKPGQNGSSPRRTDQGDSEHGNTGQGGDDNGTGPPGGARAPDVAPAPATSSTTPPPAIGR